ncbi:MAG: NTP transferase domain-containing protein [Candidatus Bathyarchaeota archaeon]|nr:NTP transferase domain-containing protein [Candidatus Bathyarchaeota archaeon]
MTTTALVMAGGKGTRLALTEEKPLLRVGGKSLVDLVLSALHDAKRVDSVVVAVSRNTPKTAQHLAALPVKVLMTPGKEYVSDMGYAVKTLGLETVLAVAADLPLLTGAVVDDILERYQLCGKAALAVTVPQETREKLGFIGGYTFEHQGKRVVYAGINVNDGSRIDDAELEQEIYVLDKAEVAVNINTVDELRIAKEQFPKFSTQKP